MKKPEKPTPNSQRSLFAELREGMAALVRFRDRSPAPMDADEVGGTRTLTPVKPEISREDFDKALDAVLHDYRDTLKKLS